MPMLTANAIADPNAYRQKRLHRLGELQAHLKFLRNFVSSLLLLSFFPQNFGS